MPRNGLKKQSVSVKHQHISKESLTSDGSNKQETNEQLLMAHLSPFEQMIHKLRNETRARLA